MFLTLCNSCAQNTTTTDKDKLKLIGNVKSIEQNSFYGIEKFGEIISLNPMIMGRIGGGSIIQFDNKGNIKSIDLIDDNGIIFNSDYITYLNGEVPIIIEGYEDEGVTYKFNEKGYIIEEKFLDDNSDFKLEYKFDDLDNLVESKTIEPYGVLENIVKYKNDQYGNLIEEISYSPKTNRTGSITYKYAFDKYNNWIRRTSGTNGEYYIVERKIIYF